MDLVQIYFYNEKNSIITKLFAFFLFFPFWIRIQEINECRSESVALP